MGGSEGNGSGVNGSGTNWSCETHPTPLLRTQYAVVTLFGSSVACLSLLQNTLLILLFFKRSFFRRSYFFYFWILGMLDVVHGLAYVGVFSVVIGAEYHGDLRLYAAWHHYVVPASTLLETVRTASVYILVAASLERYLYATDAAGFCSNRKRLWGIVAVLAFSTLLKGSRAAELQVIFRPQCQGLARWFIDFTALAKLALYEKVWMFYVRNVCGIFIPFFLVIALNAATVLRNNVQWKDCSPSKRQRRKTGAETTGRGRGGRALSVGSRLMECRASQWVTKAKSRVRKGATRTLIAIVCEYVCCSGLGVALTGMEHVDPAFLHRHYDLYTHLSDAVSLLSVFSCALRLPTYCLCDVTFRKELAWFVTCTPAETTPPPLRGGGFVGGTPLQTLSQNLRRRSAVGLAKWRRLADHKPASSMEHSVSTPNFDQVRRRMELGDVVLQLVREKREREAGGSNSDEAGPSHRAAPDDQANSTTASFQAYAQIL